MAMRTVQEKLLDFLGQEATRFTIPYYQREYAWNARQCDELWNDIMAAGSRKTSHFLSMLLYLPAEGHTASGLRELDIIDGQQRIATATILLSAFEGYLRDSGATAEGATFEGYLRDNEAADDSGKTPDVDGPTPDVNVPIPDDIRKRYLTCNEAGECKIRLMGADLTTLQAILGGDEMPSRVSRRVAANHALFRAKMDEEGFDPAVFWAGVNGLLVIATELDKRDKAQVVFEGLNTKGIPLTTSDLIRNYLLVAETRETQEYLYREYWSPMEIMFDPDPGHIRLNTGFRMWLAIRNRGMRIKDKSMTYTYFKQYVEEKFDGTTEELLDELRSFCLLWAENYKCNEGRAHCSSMDWAKGKRKTLLPEQWLKGHSGCGPG